MECSLPGDGRQVSLSVLSEDSFRECRGLLTLTDYLIVIFSGICISVVAIIASFFLASTIHCFQRLKSKRTDEEEAEDWGELLDRMEITNYPQCTTQWKPRDWIKRWKTLFPWQKNPELGPCVTRVRLLTTFIRDAWMEHHYSYTWTPMIELSLKTKTVPENAVSHAPYSKVISIIFCH